MTRALAVALVVLSVISATTLSAEAAPDTYTVQDGDTLVAIGTKLGITNDQIADWVTSTVSLNGLSDGDSLKLGLVLKLPSSGSTATVSQTTSSSSASVKPGGTYTTVSGDTLLGIAAKQGISADQQLTWVQSVLTLNSMSSADSLAMGQVLTLPAGSTTTTTPATTSTTTTPSNSSTTSTSTSSTTTTGSTTATGTAISSTSATGSLSTGYSGSATSYGNGYTGRNMGCTGAGPYTPGDLSIIAVGPNMYTDFPCGTPIEVCGPKGCITGIRKDACPGCAAYQVDLSTAGLTAVCGPNSCAVRVRRLS